MANPASLEAVMNAELTTDTTEHWVEVLGSARETLQKSSASGHDIIGSEVDWRIWVEVNEAADTRADGV